MIDKDVQKNNYDLDTCKNMVNEYLQMNPEVKINFPDKLLVIKKLSKIDKNDNIDGKVEQYIREISLISNQFN